MAKIKLLVCYHKKFPLLKDGILTPIHLGRANANKENSEIKWLLENMIGDDTGENISDKNAYYNEMTAFYWAWKNYDKLENPDYIGLAHYRRHFVMEENIEKTYYIRYYDENHITDVLNYSAEKLQKIVDGCDFVTHLGRVYNLYQHYVDNQRKEDIDTAIEILKEKYPDYAETADAYMAGQVSNFYNMNIFSRELFFRYCEFVFSIMEEFEQRMPSVKNRRMFISERLTAIFVKKLMDSGQYRYKYLPVAFIEEPLEINMAFYVTNENVASVAVSIQSILRYINDYNRYVFYIFQDGSLSAENVLLLEKMINSYSNCALKITEYKEPEWLPMMLSFVLPNLNKCLLLTEAAIATKDIADFYRMVVVDDFFVSGVPENAHDKADENARIVADMMMLNCKRIRSNTKLADYIAMLGTGEDGGEALNRCWKNEIKYIAPYWYLSERLRLTSTYVYLSDKSRQELQTEATWCSFILFDEMDPFINTQGIYAKFWWNAYQELPEGLKAISYDENSLERLWKNQLDEIWLKSNYGIVRHVVQSEEEQKEDSAVTFNAQHSEEEAPQTEDWRSYGLWGKLKFYYRHNGMKNTVKYAGQKIFGKKE